MRLIKLSDIRGESQRWLVRAMVFATAVVPTVVFGEPAAMAKVETALPAGGLPADYFTKLGVGLLLVIAAFIAFTWVLRRLNGLQAGNQRYLRVVSSIGLGHRERLVVIAAGDKHLLLGVCPGNIRMLSELNGEAEDQSSVTTPSFASQLKGALNPSASP